MLMYLALLALFFTSNAACHEAHKISDEEHYQSKSHHNADYDHDAFLGKGHGHDFDSLDPEEAKRRLEDMITSKVRNTLSFRGKFFMHVDYDYLLSTGFILFYTFICNLIENINCACLYKSSGSKQGKSTNFHKWYS